MGEISRTTKEYDPLAKEFHFGGDAGHYGAVCVLVGQRETRRDEEE